MIVIRAGGVLLSGFAFLLLCVVAALMEHYGFFGGFMINGVDVLYLLVTGGVLVAGVEAAAFAFWPGLPERIAEQW